MSCVTMDYHRSESHDSPIEALLNQLEAAEAAASATADGANSTPADTENVPYPTIELFLDQEGALPSSPILVPYCVFSRLSSPT